MNITITAFGIAKDIIGRRTSKLQLPEGSKIIDLKQEIIQNYPEFSQLAKLSFAVEESYQNDNFSLTDQMEVIIIPPVAGG